MKYRGPSIKQNEEILQMVETKREIMDTVRSRQKRWLGHFRRHDSLLRITLEGQIQGNVLGLATDEEEVNYEELKMFAQDRSRWSQ